MDTHTHMRCPICRQPLSCDGNSVRCETGHSYDKAKEGYINLLPVNKKNSKNPGDNAEMINARRSFLEKGYYQKLASHVSDVLDHNKMQCVLDYGCGEGYYTGDLFQSTNCIKVIGIDISKNAIKKAAKKYHQNQYIVGSVYDVPLADSSIDAIVSIFAPIDPLEMKRLLVDNGQLIIVSAGADHMREIAEIIYDEYKPHNYDPMITLEESFVLSDMQQITYKIQPLDQGDMKSLLMMTPYYYSASDEIKSSIYDTRMSITCDFIIRTITKKPHQKM